MLTFVLSTSCTRIVRLRIEASAQSNDVLEKIKRQHCWIDPTDGMAVYQVKMVNMKFNDAFEA